MCPHGVVPSAPDMATKARHLKTPLQLWIADNRKAKGLAPADLAQATGVTTDTARGWESRGAPSQDALSVLERVFGVSAPVGQAPVGDTAAIVAAIDRLTEAVERQTNARTEWERGLLEAVGELLREGRPSADPVAVPHEPALR